MKHFLFFSYLAWKELFINNNNSNDKMFLIYTSTMVNYIGDATYSKVLM